MSKVFADVDGDVTCFGVVLAEVVRVNQDKVEVNCFCVVVSKFDDVDSDTEALLLVVRNFDVVLSILVLVVPDEEKVVLDTCGVDLAEDVAVIPRDDEVVFGVNCFVVVLTECHVVVAGVVVVDMFRHLKEPIVFMHV